jgi:hypothetical protein
MEEKMYLKGRPTKLDIGEIVIVISVGLGYNVCEYNLEVLHSNSKN